MKRTILLGLALVCTAAAFAQEKDAKSLKSKGPYIRAGLGYAFPHAGGLYKGSSSYTGNAATLDLKKGSLGEGISGVVAGGYKFTRTIALELGIGVGIAPKKQTATMSYTTSMITSRETKLYAKTPVYLMPAVVISSGNNWFEPYARAGLMINVAGKIITDETTTYRPSSGSPDVSVTQTEVTLRTGIGLQGALGLKYHFNDKTSIWAEAAGVSQNLYPKRSEMTRATRNGVNVLDNFTTSERIVNYEFNYTQIAQPTNLPGTESAVPVAFSNIGINLGVSFQF